MLANTHTHTQKMLKFILLHFDCIFFENTITSFLLIIQENLKNSLLLCKREKQLAGNSNSCGMNMKNLIGNLIGKYVTRMIFQIHIYLLVNMIELK